MMSRLTRTRCARIARALEASENPQELTSQDAVIEVWNEVKAAVRAVRRIVDAAIARTGREILLGGGGSQIKGLGLAIEEVSTVVALRRADGFTADGPDKTILTGFGHNAVLGVADKVVEAVKAGAILANWDPLTRPIITEFAGQVKFENIEEGLTVAKQVDATITPVLATLQQIVQALTTATTAIVNTVNQAQPKSA